jgi:hypothetical protein
MRSVTSRRYGGLEEHPTTFFEWVRAVAQYQPSAGWIAGVVGIHPWEIAILDPKLQNEIYGNDPDTWVARTHRTGRKVAQMVVGSFTSVSLDPPLGKPLGLRTIRADRPRAAAVPRRGSGRRG